METKHIGYLDGWRGLAITCVLASHFVQVPGIAIGRMGVDLFFVLSGLLMSGILYTQRTPLPVFYRRRISRVVPVFALYLITVAAFAAATGVHWRLDEIAASAVFVRTYWPVDIPIWETAVPAGHLWSLSVEEHSYILLALLAAVPLARRKEGWSLIGLGALLAALTLYYWLTPTIREAGDFSLHTEVAALGLVVSAGYRQVRHHFARFVRPWMPLVALAAAVVCYLDVMHSGLKVFIAPWLLAVAINHIGDSYRWVLQMLSVRALRMLGIWSYSIYLWQQPFHKQHLMPLWAGLLCAFAVALVSYYVVEMPARRWLNENWGSRPRARELSEPLPD